MSPIHSVLIGKGIHALRGHPGHSHGKEGRAMGGDGFLTEAQRRFGQNAVLRSACEGFRGNSCPQFLRDLVSLPINVKTGPFGVCRDLPALCREFNYDPDQDTTRDHVTSPREMQEGGFQVVAGAFGIPAAAPASELIRHNVCPPGMVLGRDDLCYPKQILRRDSKFRKWRPGVRPILTGGERRGIQKAKRSVNRARDAITGLGVTVQKPKKG